MPAHQAACTLLVRKESFQRLMFCDNCEALELYVSESDRKKNLIGLLELSSWTCRSTATSWQSHA